MEILRKFGQIEGINLFDTFVRLFKANKKCENVGKFTRKSGFC